MTVHPDASWKGGRGMLDFSVPSEPRIYNHFLGGTDNYMVDRELAARLLAVAPWLPRLAQANRRYGKHAVKYLARRGVSQFLDLGCGLPTYDGDHTHEAAHAVRRDVHTVYVDRDGVVAAHARMTLAEGRQEAAVQADITDLDMLLATPQVQAFDRGRPVAVLLHDVLPWIADDTAAGRLLSVLRSWLPPGSAISVTHPVTEVHPHAMARLVELYREGGIAFRPRGRAAVAQLLGDWPLLSPGPVPFLPASLAAGIALSPDPNPGKSIPCPP